jgi:putative nucleotidyltransferase with HDIG domain
MNQRPSRAVTGAMLVALAAAIVTAILLAPASSWDPGLLATLLVLSVASDLVAIKTRVHRVFVSASFLAIVTAAVLLGASAAAAIGVVTILAGWARRPYWSDDLLINLVTYAWFPLLGGVAFAEVTAAAGVDGIDPIYYLYVLGLFVGALAIDFTLIAGYSAYVERSRFKTKVRRGLLPVLPSELAAAMLVVGFVFTHVRLGDVALILFAILILVFQVLVRALLVSQGRADELELRAKQLAGFQMALLSALVRTLDLRDRMTARHSAAVARYARAVAAHLGMSEEEQELVHTAGLLHDIGKFVLPDSILKGGRRPLSGAEWRQIRRHPEEGARIVSQIDGYAPIGEIIHAHHERIDGKGYPRGLRGEDIPALARIIAVVDVYDVLTARDSYREPVDSYEAIAELRRCAGTQFDPRFVEALAKILADKDLDYRHGEDADFERELALDKRTHEYATSSAYEPLDERVTSGARI